MDRVWDFEKYIVRDNRAYLAQRYRQLDRYVVKALSVEAIDMCE